MQGNPTTNQRLTNKEFGANQRQTNGNLGQPKDKDKSKADQQGIQGKPKTNPGVYGRGKIPRLLRSLSLTYLPRPLLLWFLVLHITAVSIRVLILILNFKFFPVT